MISVCLASYNGEKYIKEQIESILIQLPDDAELIISDDGSKDSTVQIAEAFKDERIRVIPGPQKGVVKNFENAIKNSKGDYIFLSDQDDIWRYDKVEKVMNAFAHSGCKCILHDAVVVDKSENVIFSSFFEWRGVKHGLLNNLIKNSFTGCCMAFSKDFINKIIPFPVGIEMHDWWIGLKAEMDGSVLFMDDKLISYRRHGNNTNSLDGYSIRRKIHNRLVFIKALL